MGKWVTILLFVLDSKLETRNSKQIQILKIPNDKRLIIRFHYYIRLSTLLGILLRIGLLGFGLFGFGLLGLRFCG